MAGSAMRPRGMIVAGAAALLAAVTAQASPAGAPVPDGVVDARGPVPAPHAPGQPHAARTLPDRIVLTPGADPTREMAVAFRTNTAQATAEAELALAVPAPNFGRNARRVTGRSTPILTENGMAHYHQIRFEGLRPDTAYAYRVRGVAGFSEWFQFRTAAAERRPFRFIYLGDTQNSILSIGSMAFRQSILRAGGADLMVHAGDMVASRAEMVHDDEWGDWVAAGGYAMAMIPQVPAAGNHEYVDVMLPNGEEGRKLGGHWSLQFALPDNGAPGTEATTFVTEWQGVRFIILDGTSALDLGTRDAQTRWLEEQLRRPKLDWTVVIHHQPIYTCARPNDTPDLKAAWTPLYERYGVDLVLQGHDHCYARLTSAEGREAGRRARARGATQGPVYLVSVTGSKMYGLNDRAGTQPDQVAEDTMLYQLIDVSPGRLAMRAYTMTNETYDAFDLVRRRDGRNRLEEPANLPTIRRCQASRNADGLPCTARPKD